MVNHLCRALIICYIIIITVGNRLTCDGVNENINEMKILHCIFIYLPSFEGNLNSYAKLPSGVIKLLENVMLDLRKLSADDIIFIQGRS